MTKLSTPRWHLLQQISRVRPSSNMDGMVPEKKFWILSRLPNTNVFGSLVGIRSAESLRPREPFLGNMVGKRCGGVTSSSPTVMDGAMTSSEYMQ